MRRILIFVAMVVSLAIVNKAVGQNRNARQRGGGSAQFNQLVDQFFDEYFKHNPTAGTASGFHQYDGFLEDYSKTEIANQVAANKNFLERFEHIDPRGLSPSEQDDRELVISSLRARLLELEEIRSWERNPDGYSSGVTGSVFVIMSRTFAPAADRLRSVIARERQMPKVFEDARANLKNPPRIYTEIALEQIPGIVSFFQNDVPLAFKSVTDASLQSEFQKSNQAVIDALNSYQKFLQDDVLPRSNGDFRIGAENYRKKLLYEEMVDIPLDRLLEIGYENLRANQRWFQETAKKLDPTKTPQQILDQISHDHPEPNQLLQSFRSVLGGLQQFIVAHHIITIPSPVLPIVEETPPFERALTFASMDTPGPFETVAKEAFFNVTLPETTWPREQVEEHMAGFNYGTIISTAVHEAYPGHYVQFLWVQHAPSKVRKLLGCGSNAEGWAHYCEQMMLDEGYGNGDLKLRLGQLQDALLRNARYIVGIEMHRGRMTYEQAIDFFVHEGYQSHANAERETKRGTSDPTYLVYTLGKLEIMKLREDYKRMRGSRFSLQEFHDAFMRQGFPPIKIIRRTLLGNNSPTL
ncbi:MAG TPA: DUF885 domain-containing protein [Pyrinomonadaceae bacterium]|nr:DUF885 domain-containing protein [Pyrinomonadaceae bacterium]